MSDGLWDRLSPKKQEKKPKPKVLPAQNDASLSSTRRLRTAQIVAITVWMYLITKVFVINLDYALIVAAFPNSPWILDLRILVVAVLFVGLVHFFRRYVWWIIYITFFPLILVFWHVPLKLSKFWSWDVAIGLTQIVYSVGRNFKSSVTVRVTELCCLFLIAGVKPPTLMPILAITLAICMLWTFSRALIRIFSPRGFLQAHASTAQRILQSGQVMQWASLPPVVSRSRARRFNQKQTQEVTQNLANALMVIKASDFYAYRLVKYRKGPAPFAIGMISYGLMFVYATLVLTAINIAVYKFHPAEFNLERSFSVLDFLHYTLSSLALNGVDGLIPIGSIAVAIKIFSGFFGPIILATLFLDGILSYRKDREDAATQETIEKIKREAGKVSKRVESEYQVTPSEALQRLEDLGLASTLGMVLWFSSQTPDDSSMADSPM
ncbi:hypothetical protein [Streptosporangium sp. NPDC023615]|uniref:hypothetical protein n=1 Tax=Streptosporangium sp. NPDC023615 TaxID=3154794 RepID=UPI003436EF0F